MKPIPLHAPPPSVDPTVLADTEPRAPAVQHDLPVRPAALPSVIVAKDGSIRFMAAGVPSVLWSQSPSSGQDLLSATHPAVQGALQALLYRWRRQDDTADAPPVRIIAAGHTRCVRLEIRPDDGAPSLHVFVEEEAAENGRPNDGASVSTQQAGSRVDRDVHDVIATMDITTMDIATMDITTMDITMLLLDRDLCVWRATPSAARLFELRLSDIGRPLSNLRHRFYDGRLAREGRRVLKTQTPREIEVGSDDAAWYLVRLSPEGPWLPRSGVAMTFTEITALKRSQGLLRARVLDLEAHTATITTELTMAEYREQQRIAQILHDELQPNLYAISLYLRTLRRAHAPEEDGVWDEMARGLHAAEQFTRTLITGLTSPALESVDLEEALYWLCAQKEEQLGLQIEVVVHDPCPVPDVSHRVLFYQLVSELLFNVARHAGTNRVVVRAWRTSDEAMVMVEDRGAGFDIAILSQGGEPTGRGLLSMDKRLACVAGKLDVEAAPGEGTRVLITIPDVPRV